MSLLLAYPPLSFQLTLLPPPPPPPPPPSSSSSSSSSSPPPPRRSHPSSRRPPLPLSSSYILFHSPARFPRLTILVKCLPL